MILQWSTLSWSPVAPTPDHTLRCMADHLQEHQHALMVNYDAIFLRQHSARASVPESSFHTDWWPSRTDMAWVKRARVCARANRGCRSGASELPHGGLRARRGGTGSVLVQLALGEPLDGGWTIHVLEGLPEIRQGFCEHWCWACLQVGVRYGHFQFARKIALVLKGLRGGFWPGWCCCFSGFLALVRIPQPTHCIPHG